MAKKKNIIDNVFLQCTSCKERNYSVRKNKKNSPDRMEVSKYCSGERKHTVHKEVK